ncbi:MAG: GyrI-like domain-containing protein [Cytophagales bacterium]|nr:GyrI-like domain-containing protein [Cytophagales bacterium]
MALSLTSLGAYVWVDQPYNRTMKSQTVSTFKVVGVATRIANVEGNSVEEVEALWGKFWGNDIRNKVPNRLGEEFYAVSTDYASDYQGPYTLIIGVAVESFDDVPEGLEAIIIESDTYEKFVSKGKMPDAILRTWFEIWEDKSLTRAYRTDFTVHGAKYIDGDHAEVETFISIKE